MPRYPPRAPAVRTRTVTFGVVVGCAALVLGCRTERSRELPARTAQTAPVGTLDALDTMPADWAPLPVSAIPDGPVGASIRRGLAILLAPRDSLPEYVGANLRCTSCHLDEGRRPHANPWSGAYARYPRYVERTGALASLEDRVNYCFTRSLAGSAIPVRSTEMRDIIAYLRFLSVGIPVGTLVAGKGTPALPRLTGDSARGAVVYATQCARCHGSDGRGIPPAPALWGEESYSIGASAARRSVFASFVRYNMPFDEPGILTDQEAYDVAAFVDAHPRPDLPGKERDWPNGDAPYDVPYATRGHAAHAPPARLLPRKHPERAVVPPPTSVHGERSP